MTRPESRDSKNASQELVRSVCERLAANKPVRRTLPGKGRLHIDRQLPFLCVHRRRSGDASTFRLVRGEASYLVAPAASRHRASVAALVRAVVRTLAPEFGAFLIVEIWAGRAEADQEVPPTFRVVAPKSAALAKTVDVLAGRLGNVSILKRQLAVDVVHAAECGPPDLEPLLDPETAAEHGCSVIGVAVPPVYRDAASRQEYPLVLRRLHRDLGRALRPTFYQFARSRTTHRPPHYHELGRRAVVKAVWEVDRKLGEVSSAFDFLLQVSPINADDAWQEFRRKDFTTAPEFYYRPTPADPLVLKRKLFEIPITRLEDPALQQLFAEKQDELDRRITMLRDRDTPRFLLGSQQLYGGVEDDLLRLARKVLRAVPTRARADPGKALDAKAFAARARAEIQRYRELHPGFAAKVRLTSRVGGIMVSRGALLINPNTKVPRARVNALLQHEVGTHLLTYYNGWAQPFRQLRTGLAGYEDLQEGLAVLAEYLVGGLDPRRLRQLAARVVAVHRLVDGTSFAHTFQELHETYGFPQRSAFTITMRVFRGGGLTKDAIYLRGLRQILRYVHGGGELEPLFVGKIAIGHIPLIRELRLRRVLNPVPVSPLYLKKKGVAERLAALRDGAPSVLTLVRPGAHK